MNWQTLMAGLESWLWQTPYLDLPNYAWVASGLALVVLVLYLVISFTEPAEPEAEAFPEAEAPLPEIGGRVPSPALPPSPEPTPLPESALPFTPSTSSTPSIAPPPPAAPLEKPAPPPPAPAPSPEEEPLLLPPEGWFARLRKGLAQTQSKLAKGLDRLFSAGKLDDETIDELEEVLITSDLGVQTTMGLLERLRAAVKEQDLQPGDFKTWLKHDIQEILARVEAPLEIPAGHQGPFVIMVTGVNGTGKTTTIGKLALRFKQQGHSVLLAAADTFRFAAIEQLQIWADRAGAPLIKHQEGADPSAVAFDAIKAASARHADVVIIDTAGRLHTKVNLMEELKKVSRIVGRELPGAPHETILVLDATTGQNAVQQAKIFHQALTLTGLIMTKLDGTAKGGIIVAISDEFKIPLRFIGVGEKISDLQPFSAAEFVEALF